MFFKNVTNLGYHLNPQHLASLENLEGYIFSQKFFGQTMWDDFQNRFGQLKWITYCEKFNPLLMEIGKWLE